MVPTVSIVTINDILMIEMRAVLFILTFSLSYSGPIWDTTIDPGKLCRTWHIERISNDPEDMSYSEAWRFNANGTLEIVGTGSGIVVARMHWRTELPDLLLIGSGDMEHTYRILELTEEVFEITALVEGKGKTIRFGCKKR